MLEKSYNVGHKEYSLEKNMYVLYFTEEGNIGQQIKLIPKVS